MTAKICSDRLKLPLAFDPARLAGDLEIAERVQPWVAHFVPDNYAGDWSVIPLRARAGATHPVMAISSDPSCRDFVDTPTLQSCPYFREVLAAFASPLLSARLMRLGPASEIRAHSDHDLEFEQGVVRLHIPVVTNPDVTFLLNAIPVQMDVGSCWYLRLADLHSVTNRGPRSRVHLVLDVLVDAWLESLFEQALEARDSEGLAAFRRLVVGDAGLTDRLRTIGDRDLFVRAVIEAGAASSFRFEISDVESALREGQLSWLSQGAPVL